MFKVKTHYLEQKGENTLEQYIMLLRKSQMDRDFENLSVEETLKRHRATLEEFCRQRKINVTVVLEEVVSGESLSSRPKMLELLELVNTGKYAGVVCMDIDRLSRGSSLDSGYIMQVLQINNCKIITPAKTYDLANESDEQFTDMKFMFSRYELKTITKRLQAGRFASIKEGKYVGGIRPYGYEKTKLKGVKGFTLTPVPDEAKIVQMIFNIYLNGSLGFRGIANYLNELGVPAKDPTKEWTHSGIASIIQNPVYAGQVRRHQTKIVKTIEDGKVVKKQVWTPDQSEVFDGLHEPIVSEEIWNTAQNIRIKKLVNPNKKQHAIKNPFAGVLRCACCGKPYYMVDATKHGGSIRFQCRTYKCPNRSLPYAEVHNAVFQQMRLWLDQYTIQIDGQTPYKDTNLTDSLEIIKNRIAELEEQQNVICDKFERNEYSPALFKKRNSVIESQIAELVDSKKALEQKIAEQSETDTVRQMIIPTAQKLLDSYEQMTPEEQNKLWKEVLEKITAERLDKKDMIIKIYPKI